VNRARASAAGDVAGEDLEDARFRGRLSPAALREIARIARRVERDPLDAPLVAFLRARHPELRRAMQLAAADEYFRELQAEGHSLRKASKLTGARFGLHADTIRLRRRRVVERLGTGVGSRGVGSRPPLMRPRGEDVA
jgi:hypothetical protein